MDQAFQTALRDYYRAPDAQRMGELFQSAPLDECLPSQWVLTLPVFLALLMDQAPTLVRQWVEKAVVSHPVRIEIMAQALNYSHLPDRCRLMERLVGESAAARMDEAGADFLALTPSHPVHVDMKWLAFFATGQTAYVEQICSLLADWLPEGPLSSLVQQARQQAEKQPQAMAALLAAAAYDSLQAHGAHLPEVRAVLYRMGQKGDGLVSALCSRLLAAITERP